MTWSAISQVRNNLKRMLLGKGLSLGVFSSERSCKGIELLASSPVCIRQTYPTGEFYNIAYNYSEHSFLCKIIFLVEWCLCYFLICGVNEA